MELSIPIRKISDDAILPSYAHAGDAGCDLHSTIETTLEPFERALVPCGFAMDLPKGYAALVLPRSGLAIKNGISLVNSPGLIDSGYRGEIKVAIINMDPKESFKISIGDRIAQLVITSFPKIDFEITDELSESQRGSGGFGSSGV